MSLLTLSGLTTDDLARYLSMDTVDDETGLTLALEAACSDIEPLVWTYDDVTPVPPGLKVAILQIAATRYQRTNLMGTERIGPIVNDYTSEYDNMMQRIAPYRSFAGL